MTFIPSVISKIDTSNSVNITASSFSGVSSRTTGYNQIQISLTVSVPSIPLGLTISFSSDGISFSPMFSDSVFTNSHYYRTFPVLNTFYKVDLVLTASGNIQLETRLDTTESKYPSFYETSENSFYDAFSKLRVSMPYSIIDLRFPSQTVASGTNVLVRENNMIVCSKATGSFSAVFERSKALISGSGIGSYISQTRQYAIYQPGKSQLFLGSGLIGNVGTGGTSGSPDYSAYIGIFDNQNGLFFSYDSVNGIGVNLRKDGSDTMILQSSWNIDPMDGTGKSGINLDFTKTQLFVIDFEWLGVGRIRYGFYAFGQIFYCHQILNINILTECYMINCNLPIRYQLVGRNASPTTPTAFLTQLCSSIISEGGYNPSGRPFAISRTTKTTIGGGGTTELPILAIRYKSTANHENIVPSQSTIVCTSSNDLVIFRFRLYLAPNSPGTISAWTSVDPNSLIEYAITTDISGYVTTNSIILDESYVIGKNTTTYVGLSSIFKLVQLTANVDNVSDIIVLSVLNPNNSGLDVYGSLTWQEAY